MVPYAAVPAEDKVISGFHQVICGVLKVEDIGFTTSVKAVSEGAFLRPFRHGQIVIPVVSVDLGFAPQLLHGLVCPLRKTIGLLVGRGCLPCEERQVCNKAVATIHWEAKGRDQR